MLHRSIALIFALLMVAVPAKADPTAVQSTITAQLDAFRAGDADAAYALAAPSIKRMFPTAERFISMVQSGYRPVYNARNPVFLRSQSIDETRFAQEVSLSDQDGQAWTALYTLALQDDGTWRITGCYLRKADGSNI
ncbi:MAG: DUF4864 domain-containing protein [Pseudomonadota bacterium]